MPPPADHLLVAMGANLPIADQLPSVTLGLAAKALATAGIGGLRMSRLYATPCFPVGAGPDYVNAVAIAPIPVGWTADQTLALLHRIEAGFGRTRTNRWGMRTLDLDLLAFGVSVLPDAATHARWRDLPVGLQAKEAPDRLILPHPRLADRAFVLVPLADVAPDWHHPVTGLTTLEMLDALPLSERRQVVPLDV